MENFFFKSEFEFEFFLKEETSKKKNSTKR